MMDTLYVNGEKYIHNIETVNNTDPQKGARKTQEPAQTNTKSQHPIRV